jgi:hypothetical protein
MTLFASCNFNGTSQGMNSIILIGTGHWELGLYNSGELLKLIKEINPEIIFEETNRRQHDAVYAGLREALQKLTQLRNIYK